MKKLYLFFYKLLSAKQLTQAAVIAFCFAAASSMPCKLFAQAPTIGYSSPHIFAENTAVALTPASSNVAAPTGAYSSGVVLGSGLTFSQNGVALDAAGNIYVADIESTGEVKKITADGSSTTIIGSGFLTQSANVAVDQAGNVFVTDQGQLWKIPASGMPVTYGTPIVIGTFSRPFGIATDAAGAVYVSDLSIGGVYKMANDGSNKVRIDNGSINQATALAVDSAGNVYATDLTNLALYEIPGNGSPQIQLATGFSFPRGVAVDAAGTLYVDDEGKSGIYAVPAGGGTPVAVVSGLSNLVGLAVDASYNLYGALQGSSGIVKMSPTGGYFISPALPPGLTLNATSGVISGTPTTAFGPRAYTVSAYNATGGDVDTLTLSAGPPPAISYSTPQTYTAGTAISALPPSAGGAPVTTPGYGSIPATVSWGFGSPAGAAIDAAGNIYVADKANNVILKIPPGGGNPTTITAALNSPTGVAVDKSGIIYVADSQNGVVKQISSDLSTVTTVGSGFTNPVSVALDPAGNLFIGDAGTGGGSGIVYEIEKATGKQSLFVGGFEDLGGLATDAAGNVYVTDETAGALFKYTARSNLSLEFAAVFSFPTGVAVDASGNIFVSDGNGGQVYEIPGGNNAPVSIGSGFGFPAGVVTDGAGNVYVSDAGPNVLYKVSPTGGYYVNQSLPRGLKLNDTTGVISGTPKAVSAAADYFITAFASGVPGTAARVNIAVNAAPLPAISYTSPQIYTSGPAITPLSPGNTGGPVAGLSYSDILRPLGSGFSHPAGTAVDVQGNIYVADNLNNLVMKIPAGGGTPVSIGGSFSAPAAVAVDSTGNVYVADEGNQQIVEIPAGGGSNIILGSGFVGPNGVAVDPSGNVFVTDESNQTVSEIPAGNLAPVTLFSGFFSLLTGIAVDASDNIYVADGGSSAVYKLPLTGPGIPFNIGSFFDYPTGVAVDAAGNVYVADQGPNVIYRIPANNSGQFTIISELNNPGGIAVDPYGNLYIADTDNNAVEELSPVGGYFINKPLPLGLSLSSFSGTISGGPLTVSPATTYLVSAYNSGGISQASLTITVNLPPPPAISYVTPQVFVQNAAISPLSPTAANVAPPAYGLVPTAIGSGISFPFATAVDQSGNVYVADPTANSIYEILAGGPQITVGTNLDGPVGVAVDQFGNVYVANQGNNTVMEIHAHTGLQTYKGNGYQGVSAVAVDSAGNVYVADLQFSGGVVYKVRPGFNKQLFKSGFSDPNGIAVDAAGNVYVSDGGSGPPSRVYKISPDGSTETHLHQFFNEATGVAIDATGNLFIADGAGSDITEYPAGGGPAITITSGLVAPFGPSVDGAGNLYAADFATGNVEKLTPSGGYFINRVLPAGLSLNANTGVISGTPVVASPATNYFLTAYNTAAGVADTLSISVLSSNDSLSSLKMSKGIFSPAFAAATTSYADAVGNTVTSVTVTPTAADPSAVIQVNGTTVSSGTASDPINLGIGANAIYVTVTAPGGAFQTDTVTVTRAPSGNDNLFSLKMSKGIFSPAFANTTSSYADAVGNTITSVTVTPTAIDPDATIQVNGATVPSGTASGPVTLSVGPNPIYVTVTASDGTTAKTDTITVSRASSTNAKLFTLKMSKGIFSPAFTNTTTSYTDAVGNTITSVTVTPTALDPDATILVNGTTVPSGTASGSVTLSVGPNPIYVAVTASDGTTIKTDTITVMRAPSTNDKLISLKMSNGIFGPAFSPTNFSYTDAIGNTISTVTVTATTADPTATITVNGTTVTSGTASPVNMPFGSSAINVKVTAQDGSTSQTYAIAVIRPANSNADLFSLRVSMGRFGWPFDRNVLSYADTVSNDKTTIKLTPTTLDTGARVTVNGTPVISGTASGPVSLVLGNNSIPVIVTAEDGTTKTYTVNVLRPAFTSDNLAALKVSKGIFGPAFESSNLNYTDNVGNSISSITVTPTAGNPTATIKVNGLPVVSGAESAPVNLAAGSTTISITVKAQDSITTKTYTITVNRAPGSVDSFGQGISVTKPVETPTLAEDGIQVHQGVSPNGDGINDFLQIDNISLYPDNKLSIMNRNGQLVYEASGYDNSSRVFDGHSNKNGQMQLPGTYFYQLDYTVSGIAKHKTGFIVLKY